MDRAISEFYAANQYSPGSYEDLVQGGFLHNDRNIRDYWIIEFRGEPLVEFVAISTIELSKKKLVEVVYNRETQRFNEYIEDISEN